MEQLKKALAQLNIHVDEKMLHQFNNYMEQILSWNEKVNLTAIKDPDEFIKKHYVDSVLCANYDEIAGAKTVIDVGTGAGFPGIPLALIFPEKHFLLIDSLDKRIKIIKEICQAIEIRNVEAVHGRAEELAFQQKYRQQFDLCVSRAVAKLPVLAEYCLPFVKIGGFFLSYKGPDTEDERFQAKKALKALGGELIEERKANLEGFDLNHTLLVMKKTQNTPAKYPRKSGIPSKKPLI